MASYIETPWGQRIRNPVLVHSQIEGGYNCLRVNVFAGSDLEAALGVGQMPFLYVIGLLQKAKWLGTNVDTPAGRYLMTTLHVYLRPGYPDSINCWDPWLFEFATGS